MKINEDGNLVAGFNSEAPYIFEPVTGYEKLHGDWLLSGLESRKFDNRIWTMPQTHRVKNEDAIKEMNAVLSVTKDRLKMQLGCRIITSNIKALKPGFIRLDKNEWSNDENCDSKENNRDVTKLLSVISAYYGHATLKVDFDETTQRLTLTRASIGAYARSHSWTFTR